MNNIYEKNLHTKETGMAVFAESVESQTGSHKQNSIIVENLFSKSGLLTSRFKRIESEPFVFVHSSYDPIQEAKRKIDELNLKKNTMVVVFGIGLGYHLFELKKRISEQSRVVVIENSMDIFNNVMRNIDLTELFNDRRFAFLLGLSREQISFYFKDLFTNTFTFYISSGTQYVSLSYYDKLFPTLSQEITKDILNNLLGTWRSLGNCAADTLIGLVQNFKNIDHALDNPGIAEIADILRENFRNKPAVIVSAGPSLDKNIHLLKEIEGKALILANDATIRALTKKGIRPDAVFTIERAKVHECFYKNRDFEIPKEVVLVAPPLVQPEIFKEFEDNKKIACFRALEPINVWINDNIGNKGSILMGGSVAHLAFGFALAVGSNPIVFVGQDLAYSNDGDTHGKDVSEELKELSKKAFTDKQETFLTDYNGNPIKSTLIWKTFLNWFENKFMEFSDRMYIDATEGGAYKRGTQIMTLKETIEKHIKHHSMKRLNEVIPETKLADRKEMYKSLIEAMDEKINYFEKMLTISRDCLEGIDKIRKKFEKRYLSMTVDENKEVCSQLLKADELYNLMKNEGIAMQFFQGLFASTIYQINELGLELDNENVWKNVNIQDDFLIVSTNISFSVVSTMTKLKEFLKEKLKRYPEPVDINKYVNLYSSEEERKKEITDELEG